MEKAKIDVLDKNLNVSRTIEVMFNPADYSLQLNNKFDWKTVPGTAMPVGQFVSGEAQVMTVNLFFDTFLMTEDEISAKVSSPTRTDLKDVRNFTDMITKLMLIDSELHAPPICVFAWGSFQFKGIVEKAAQKFTMFLPSGIPVRAKLDVTFKEFRNLTEQSQATPMNSSDRTKQRTLIEGDHLWTVAAKEYGDGGLWREIAKANNISNPRVVEPGKNIIIPPLE